MQAESCQHILPQLYCFSEKKEIGKERLGLQKRVDELLMEKERLQAANAELQRQRDNAEDEKEDLMKDLARKEDDLERLLVALFT